MKKIKTQLHSALIIIEVLLIALGGIALYNLVTEGTNSLLTKIGIINPIWQSLILLGVALLTLFLGGFGFWKSIKKLAGA
jgi:hypothetical protein